MAAPTSKRTLHKFSDTELTTQWSIDNIRIVHEL